MPFAHDRRAAGGAGRESQDHPSTVLANDVVYSTLRLFVGAEPPGLKCREVLDVERFAAGTLGRINPQERLRAVIEGEVIIVWHPASLRIPSA